MMRSTSQPSYRWLQRLMALLALLNLVLVGFELSYSYCRDVYLHYIPGLVQRYDPIKDIEPHPFTQYYLDRVDGLEAELIQSGIESAKTEAVLSELRQLSQQMVVENPFAGAKKDRMLAKVEREISDRTNTFSAQTAFDRFWSQDYLATVGWQQELAFFDQTLRPLFNTNFYRDLNQFGKYVDRFWWIDLPFIIIFALDILIRAYFTSRKCPNLTWLEAILRRWYDWFLLIPFWRWLRVIPVTIRLYQTDLINLDPLRAQLNRDFAINFAGKMTETVGIQLIDQMQDSIKTGEAADWIFHPEARRPYVQVNPTNEIEAIITRLFTISIRDVLPKLQPDLESLFQHSLITTFSQSPVYQRLEKLPGLKDFPARFTDQLAKDLSQAACSSLVTALDDPVTAKLIAQLAANFTETLNQEVQKHQNIQPIQSWLIDLLEEVKINYVKRVAEVGLEQVVEEAELLQQQTIGNGKSYALESASTQPESSVGHRL